jgi:hypothetical protein
LSSEVQGGSLLNLRMNQEGGERIPRDHHLYRETASGALIQSVIGTTRASFTR